MEISSSDRERGSVLRYLNTTLTCTDPASNKSTKNVVRLNRDNYICHSRDFEFGTIANLPVFDRG